MGLWDQFKRNWSNAGTWLVGGPGWVNGAQAALSAYSPETFNQLYGQKDNSAEQNAALQREFAQNGLQWRVEDAKKAGIHPVAALGFQGPSAQPVFNMPADDFGSSLGQDLTRAFMATRGPSERAQRYEEAQVQNMELQNDLLRSQIARSNSAQSSPGIPVGSVPGSPSQENKSISDVGYTHTATGGLMPVPSEAVKERIEDNMFHEAAHFYRNNLLPNFGYGKPPPDSMLPKGAKNWQWDYLNQDWRPNYKQYPWDYRTDGR